MNRSSSPLLLLLLTLFLSLPMLAQEEGEGQYVTSDLLASLKPGDKAALLMVHFGTSYADTRALTIDAINAKAREAFPELEVREAYTSRIIIRKLGRSGLKKVTPLEALFALRSEGYTHVVVQSTHLIDGVEMESLRHDVESMAPFFKEIRVGTPLIYSVDDAAKVADILATRHANDQKKAHVMLVGHGTYTPATATYSQMDYMLKAAGHTHFHVATIEGYPTLQTALAQIKADKGKSVTLVPLMFVAGDHARNDIAGEWKEALEAEGLTVTTVMEGLGQVPEIQDLYIDHIRFSLSHRTVGVMEKKTFYNER